MLKRVPAQLSPYNYPRKPGLWTVVFYHTVQETLIELSLTLEGTFNLLEFSYGIDSEDPSPGVLDIFQTLPEATAYWETRLSAIELAGYDQLLLTILPIPTPVGGGYAGGPFTVTNAVYNPWTNVFVLEGAGPEAFRIQDGRLAGNVNAGLAFLDHLQGTFGTMPNVTL